MNVDATLEAARSLPNAASQARGALDHLAMALEAVIALTSPLRAGTLMPCI
ncbi:hypothetical protein ACB284_14815 [Serratia marcescens]